ncbi:MAG TPA: hypothetical protein PK863_05070 [Candidatus Dojkabacteria bacterium]|nr:hypothetical protein [Candidatus Dojkabacteria bacterium]
MEEENTQLKKTEPPVGQFLKDYAPGSSLETLKHDEKVESKSGRFGFREQMALITGLNIGLGIIFSTTDMSVPGNSANLLAFLGTAFAGELSVVPSLYARSARNFWDKVFAIAPFASIVGTPVVTSMIN